jgi:hypothetical protein
MNFQPRSFGAGGMKARYSSGSSAQGSGVRPPTRLRDDVGPPTASQRIEGVVVWDMRRLDALLLSGSRWPDDWAPCCLGS